MSQPYRPPHMRLGQASQNSYSSEARGMLSASRAPTNSISFGPIGTPRFPSAPNTLTRRPSVPVAPAPSVTSNEGGVMLPPSEVLRRGSHPSNASRTMSPPTQVINIRIERATRFSHPRTPTFISNAFIESRDLNVWYKAIMPALSETLFVIESNPDLQWFKDFMNAQDIFPDVHLAITKLYFPNFHWFSGVVLNRKVNPYIVSAVAAQNLGELNFTLHTAGLTCSSWGEKQRMEIEKTDVLKSKELKPMSVGDIVSKYGLDRIFGCTKLHTITITCIDSDMVAFHCKSMNPVTMAYKIQEWLVNGFRRYRKVVNVNVVVVGGSPDESQTQSK